MPLQLPENAACLGCGYSLHALTEPRCPECGRAFDPSNRSTYRLRAAGFNWHWWAKQPGFLHVLGVLSVTLPVFWARSGATNDILMSLPWPIPVAGLFLLALYALKLAALGVDRARAGHQLTEKARSVSKVLPWLITPICLALVISTYITRWPLHWRFAASQAAFEAEALRQLAERPADSLKIVSYHRYIGLFYVGSIHVCGDPPTATFWTDDFLLDYSRGFQYCPQGGGSGTNEGLPAGWVIF